MNPQLAHVHAQEDFVMPLRKSTLVYPTMFSLYVSNLACRTTFFVPCFKQSCMTLSVLLYRWPKGEERGKGGESSSWFFLQLAFTVS